MGRKGKETVRFGPDKKSCKCLSVLQAVYLFQPYPCCKPFPRPPHLSAPHAVYPRRNPFPHNPRLSAPQAVAFSRFSGK